MELTVAGVVILGMALVTVGALGIGTTRTVMAAAEGEATAPADGGAVAVGGGAMVKGGEATAAGGEETVAVHSLDGNRDTDADADVSGQGWRLVWSEEFDGPQIDRTLWNFELGHGQNGWGNRELQEYTDDPANALIDQGKLVIRALREEVGGSVGQRTTTGTAPATATTAAATQATATAPAPSPDMATTQAAAPAAAPATVPATATASSGVRYRYTSARMTTQRHYTVRYGRIEVRAKLPEGQGIWPAVWLLGADIPTRGWPACGEIDLLELVGSRPGTVHGTIHGPLSGGVGIGGAYTLPGGRKFSEDFHVFALEWDERSMRWFVDGHQYFQVLKDNMPAEYAQKEWVYDHDFFLIVNLAVGGNWPGYPDETTIFPQSLQIDYIRVYQREN